MCWPHGPDCSFTTTSYFKKKYWYPEVLTWGKQTTRLSTNYCWVLMVLENGFWFQSCFTWWICCFPIILEWHIGCFMDSGNYGYAADMGVCIAWVASGAAVVVVVTACTDWENIYQGFACCECCELLLFPMLNSLPHTPSFWDLYKHGATIGFDGRNDWKTYDVTEEMDVVPFGAKIFL